MKDHTALNRALLAFLGIVLLGGGLLVLAGGADIYRSWSLSPPTGWPLTTPQDVLVPSADQTNWAGGTWWWPTIIAALALLVLLALLWLLSQSPWKRARTMSASRASAESVTVSDKVLSDALAADLDLLPGTQRTRVHIHGAPTHPEARVDLALSPGGTPAQVLNDVDDAIERARRSADWSTLRTDIHLTVARHRPHRVE
ncbi:hypothetical protein SAMN05216223_12917 [Actinacidiphila yanglinensis]|uniref:Alkaline shock response membrane anchor protein AmaP n=1 Tax=Actinacidiphila yanglinensis TaxID=310779 RepID=A0A1H6EA85_9ACTN|nr:alkaline shock response membrane anchor protein AmaP [Actinacidiphila yanglinensis]SEG94029.1 hypothetical protein SAMN05216223_12917 [Actinacidiphila yanglinensis]